MVLIAFNEDDGIDENFKENVEVYVALINVCPLFKK